MLALHDEVSPESSCLTFGIHFRYSYGLNMVIYRISTVYLSCIYRSLQRTDRFLFIFRAGLKG